MVVYESVELDGAEVDPRKLGGDRTRCWLTSPDSFLSCPPSCTPRPPAGENEE